MRVSAVDDDEIEGDHSAVILHSAVGPGYTGIDIANVTVVVQDNDAPSLAVIESGDETAVAEGDAGDTITVALGVKPSGTVTVQFSSGGELATTPAQLTFSTANWDTPQTVLVTAVDDAEVENNHSALLSVSASGGGFESGVLASIFVTIGDNDVVELMPLSQGLQLVGWFGLPTTTRAIIESNSRILRVWVWVSTSQSWLLDSDELPDGLRTTIPIERGDGLFIVSSRNTTLEVTVAE